RRNIGIRGRFGERVLGAGGIGGVGGLRGFRWRWRVRGGKEILPECDVRNRGRRVRERGSRLGDKRRRRGRVGRGGRCRLFDNTRWLRRNFRNRGRCGRERKEPGRGGVRGGFAGGEFPRIGRRLRNGDRVAGAFLR